MNCTELLELFERVGGVLVCNLEENKAYIKNTKLKCDIKPSDNFKFVQLRNKYYFIPNTLEFIKYGKSDTIYYDILSAAVVGAAKHKNLTPDVYQITLLKSE